MKIILVQPCVDPKVPAEWPPMAAGYMATALRNAGHDPYILDYPLRYKTDGEFGLALARHNPQPDVIGFSCFTRNIQHVRTLAQIAKRVWPSVNIVIGGAHVSSLPESALWDIPEADYGVAGEGEHPLVALLAGLPPEKVPGLIWRDGPSIVNRNPSYFAPDVDAYGIPAWDLIQPQRYDITTDPLGRAAPLLTSRGCPFRCSFCAAEVASGPKWRRRSLDLVFREMALLRDTYGIRRFVTYDEGFGASKKQMMEFVQQVHARGFTDCKFDCGTGFRLDQVDVELLTALKTINFRRLVPLGIESGSERILKLMHKQSNLALIREKVLLMDREGFRPCAYVILGYPTETREEMQATIDLTMELPFRQASYMTFQPLPGTEATRLLIESGELPRDFDYASIGNGAVVYAPKGMTTKELQNIRRKAILRFFWRPRKIFAMMTSWREIKNLFRRFWRIYFTNRAR